MHCPAVTLQQAVLRARALHRFRQEFETTAVAAARATIRHRAGVAAEGGVAGGDKVHTASDLRFVKEQMYR